MSEYTVKTNLEKMFLLTQKFVHVTTKQHVRN